MNLEVIPKILDGILKEEELKLFEYKFVKEDNNLFLRVIIDKPNGGVDINLLAKINEYLSTELDKYDSDLDEYYLEVSSLGAERTLNDKEDIINSIGKYIHVELKNNNIIYEGSLIDANQTELIIRVNFKGRFKNLTINYEDIKFIRLAVKL